jgi:hypothetical protein
LHSNVESTFSMMKRKFGDGLRSKTNVAMVNETLCKILCHNLVVLIHEMCELGIDPVFWPDTTVAVGVREDGSCETHFATCPQVEKFRKRNHK